MDQESPWEQWLTGILLQLAQLGRLVDLYIGYGSGQLSLDPLILYLVLFIALLGTICFLRRYKRRLGRWTQRDLQAMNDRAFEGLIASLWEEMGYRTTTTPPGSDRGIDVIAVQKRLFGLLGSKRIAIQAKRYGPYHKVTAEELMKYAAIPLRSDQKFHGVIVVTSSGFTEPALKEGRELRTIEALVDGPQLVELLNAHLDHPRRRPKPSWIVRVNVLAAQLIIWAGIGGLLIGLATHLRWLHV